MSSIFIGIDVSKHNLDVATYPEVASWSVTNDQAGIKSLVKKLAKLQPERIVMEATGGYQASALAELAAAGLPVVAVNPTQTRSFARATGVSAKTDRIDAIVLARFAEAVKTPIRPVPDAQASELRELATRRGQVVRMITSEKNRRENASTRVRKELDRHIAWLEKTLKRIDDDMQKTIRNTPAWREKDDLLRSVKGIGPNTSALLIAELPELGELDRHKIARLAGLAPINRDSGRFRGERHIQGGRAAVRSAIYMATLTAIRHNPVIAAFYRHLRDAGKKFKVAITACMRKLIVRLNAMLRDGVPWQHESPEKSTKAA